MQRAARKQLERRRRKKRILLEDLGSETEWFEERCCRVATLPPDADRVDKMRVISVKFASRLW